MTDKELLELAAKAAGTKIIRITDTGMPLIHGKDENGKHWDSWNPLTDDGDALRLAVKLKMQVQINEASVIAELPQSDIGETKEVIEYFDEPEESYAATRRAIVRAAAEIGKGMK